MGPNTRERKGGRNMANSTISRDIVELVKKQVDREVKRSIEAIIKARIEFEVGQRDYFKISIHSPHAGRDLLPAVHLRLDRDFNPLSPCGERLDSN